MRSYYREKRKSAELSSVNISSLNCPAALHFNVRFINCYSFNIETETTPDIGRQVSSSCFSGV